MTLLSVLVNWLLFLGSLMAHLYSTGQRKNYQQVKRKLHIYNPCNFHPYQYSLIKVTYATTVDMVTSSESAQKS